MMKLQNIFLLFLIFVLSCKKENSETLLAGTDSQFKFITHIKWLENKDSIFINSGGEKLRFSKKELPIQTAMVIPTAAMAYMAELDLMDKITGVSQPDFIFNPAIQQLIQERKILEIGSYNEIFIEKILVQKPDLFISTSSPTLAKFHELLKNEGIKILYIDEYEELEPLAKAEYVKIFGILFGKEKEANDLFDQIESNYNEIKNLVEKNKVKNPSVFANQMYGDVWYMPGGKSFQAKLIEDAGGNYLWKSDGRTRTLNLSFESVFEKASEAEIWINAGDFPDKAALLASHGNHGWFSAYKNGKIYNWNKRKSATGANDYFETGTARPDLVLKDLAAIFHPELFPGHELYFYKKLD